jgi:EamA domain-containing membrane protein RarD
MPVYGVLLAWVFLGERLAPFHVVGIALILTGIWITSRLGRRSGGLPAATEGAPVDRSGTTRKP